MKAQKDQSGYTFIREMDPTVRGQKICLIQVGESYYAVSSIPNAPDHGGPETLVFAADSAGKITSFADLAGGIRVSREEAIAQLISRGENEYGIRDEVSLVDMLTGIAFTSLPGSDYYVDGDSK